MRRLISFILIPLIVLQTFAKVEVQKQPRNTNRNATEARKSDNNRSHYTSAEVSDMSFKNLTVSILPSKNDTRSSNMTGGKTSATTKSVPHSHNHHRLKNPKRPSGKTKSNPMFTHPTDHHHRHPHFQCTATVPRMNLRLNKMLGLWYPVMFSKSTLSLWRESFQKEHKIQLKNGSCFNLEYNSRGNESTAISLAVHRANKSITMVAILIGDDKHPKGSKWAISWPNGEDTLTSVVAAGVIGKERNQYSWLLTVDCDINGIVESDWAVMARVPEGISNATLNAILAILEGLKGIRVEHAITFQSEHCH